MSPALQRPHVLIVSDDPELTAFLGEGLVYAGFWTSAIASAVRRSKSSGFAHSTLWCLTRRSAASGRSSSCGGYAAAPTAQLPPSGPTFRSCHCRIQRRARSRLAERDGADGVILAPIELEQLAAELGRAVTAWRASHPDRKWADEAALGSA